jgi:pimeloyl-ACP methyl ester carboxylesterase
MKQNFGGGEGKVSEVRSFKAPHSVLLLVKSLEIASPKLATKFLFRHFFSPIKFPTPEREEAFKHSCALHREKINDKQVTIYKKGHSGPIVLLVHGWSGRSTQFFSLAEQLVNCGFRILTFTAPAHGSSKDKQTDLFEFVETISFCQKNYGPFYAAVGHSLGGMAIINAIKRDLKIEKLVTLGAPSSVEGVVDDFINVVGASEATRALLKKALVKKYNFELDDPAPVRIMKGSQLPGLIIHDKADMDAGVDYAEALHEVWPNSKLILTEGLGHRGILHDPAIIAEITNFLKASGKP